MPAAVEVELKQQLKEVLVKHQGRAQAIKAGELAQLFEVDERRVRLAIRELLADDLPIAAATESPAGYFIPETRYEAETYLAVMKSRLIEDAYRRRDFKRAVGRWFEKSIQWRLM